MSDQITLFPESEQEQIEYRPVVGFPGYRVGSDGSVWSCLSKGGYIRKFEKEWRRLTPGVGTWGYFGVTLYREKKPHPMNVHRLILEAFVGLRPHGMEARHLNGIQTDNRLKNLEWGTKLENTADKNLHNTMSKGSHRYNSKFTDDDVREIKKRLSIGDTLAKIAADYGVYYTTIQKIKSGKSWKHVAIN